MRLIVDRKPIEFEEGDNVLVALLRSEMHPTGGGCLCLGGDCPHCLATVDGVSYIRTCQVKAKAGMVVERHHQADYPPLPQADCLGEAVTATNLHCDVVVIGQGESGRAAAEEARTAGKNVITLDVHDGQEAVGIYSGPLVVARTEKGMWHVHVKDEVIVATGSAEIHPVAEGSGLAGLVTARAATQLANADIDLGHIVAIGTPPENLKVESVSGEIVRFEGEGRVSAVVMCAENGTETAHACNTVSLGLGFHPRDALRRMGHDLPVRAIGDAARESDIPPCPLAGVVCPCSNVSVSDLDSVWERGFHEMELVKRATLAGTGTCQGSVCLPHVRSFLADRGKELQPPFTARPVTRQLTIGEIAAGGHHHPTARTALDAIHRQLGARMERSGGWWRPWSYGDLEAEYWAVREAVSIMDVGTLGKMTITGSDALAFLERLYPTTIRTIRTGRSRYVLLLNERGYVFDDGLVCKNDDNHYSLTFTSGGSSHAEMWVRDWSESWGMDVRIMPQTHSFGAINVTGPLATELLARAGFEQRLRFMRHTQAKVAGVDCKIFRLSFTGEASYELHHSAENSPHLWQTLMQLGQELGIKPHGLEALLACRLEKGHIIVGQDTDYDSTPRRIHHEWMVKMEKDDFIGRPSLVRTNRIPLDRELVGFEMTDAGDFGDEPYEGCVVWHNGEYAGYVTSSTYSPVLGKAVMLGWLYYFDGELPKTVIIDGRTAHRVPTPFYDKEATRAKA